MYWKTALKELFMKGWGLDEIIEYLYSDKTVKASLSKEVITAEYCLNWMNFYHHFNVLKDWWQGMNRNVFKQLEQYQSFDSRNIDFDGLSNELRSQFLRLKEENDNQIDH